MSSPSFALRNTKRVATSSLIACPCSPESSTSSSVGGEITEMPSLFHHTPPVFLPSSVSSSAGPAAGAGVGAENPLSSLDFVL